MKNFWLVLFLGVFALQSCKTNYKNAVYLTETDLFEFIKLNEAHFDSLKLNSNNESTKRLFFNNLMAQTSQILGSSSEYDVCKLFPPVCTGIRGKINGDCGPAGGPCSPVPGIEKLILYFRRIDIFTSIQFQLIDLDTGKQISMVSTPRNITNGGFTYTLDLKGSTQGNYGLVPSFDGATLNRLPFIQQKGRP